MLFVTQIEYDYRNTNSICLFITKQQIMQMFTIILIWGGYTFFFRNGFEVKLIEFISFALGLAQIWTLFPTEELDKAIEFELVLVEGEHITDFDTSPTSERWSVVGWGRSLSDFDFLVRFLLWCWWLVFPVRPALDLAYNKIHLNDHV